MNALRRTTPALAFLLAAAVLAGCGGDPQDEYCETLKAQQPELDELTERSAAGEGDVLTPTLESFRTIREDAPDELADEWDTVIFAQEGLLEAVEKAGVDPATYRPGKRPSGVTAAEARQLSAVAGKLTAPRVRGAVAGIEQHAGEVCGVVFGTSGQPQPEDS